MSRDSRHVAWLAKQERLNTERKQQKEMEDKRRAERAKKAEPTFRAWAIPLAVPGVIFTAGLAVIPFHFLIGILITALGAISFLIDWLWFARKEHWRRQVFVALLPCAALMLPVWLWFRPAPLGVFVFRMDENYTDGQMVGGIKWRSDYGEVRVFLQNESGSQYTNIGAVILTDVLIAQIGFLNEFSQCKASYYSKVPIGGAGIKPESGTTIPLFESGPVTATEYRIYCDKLLPGDKLESVIALVKGPLQNRYKARPSWISIDIEYDAFGRTRTIPIRQCLNSACKSIPSPVKYLVD
jgi:hypothetical protein